MPDNASSSRLQPADWVALAIAGMLALALLVFPLVGRRFREMYLDFGAVELPGLTVFAIEPFGTAGVGVFCLLLLGFGAAPVGRSFRRGAIGTALVLGATVLIAAGVGLYLPVFQLAGAISAS
ncbi:MAG: hypothetical protein AAGF12_02055 [Myxococcota bacterium]